MKLFLTTLVSVAFAFVWIEAAPSRAADAPAPTTAPVPAKLPGELTADQVLDGQYPFPPSPRVEAHDDDTGLAKGRLTAPPPPGVHPRFCSARTTFRGSAPA